MSWAPPTCSDCQIPTRFDRYGNAGMPGTIGVAWVCPQCDKRVLDLCPTHSELPSPGMCLNCGAPLADTSLCPACGVDRSALVESITAACGSPPALSAALELIDRGLIRLAANAIDLRLELVPEDNDTWLAKAEMLGLQGEAMLRRAIAREPDRLALPVALHGLLAQRKDYAGALLALEAALALAEANQRPALLHAKAELACTLERGDEALAAIDEALADPLGEAANNPRWHYVRGWALGILGELELAREAMLAALALSPDDAPTQRALAQIKAALGS